MNTQKRIKPIKAYAGIVEDELHYWPKELGINGGIIIAEKYAFGIYKTRKEAKEHYEKVVPVLITPINSKKK